MRIMKGNKPPDFHVIVASACKNIARSSCQVKKAFDLYPLPTVLHNSMLIDVSIAPAE